MTPTSSSCVALNTAIAVIASCAFCSVHLFEDTTLIENVDADSRPVPAGQPGARLLVTNLHNLVQPLIRVEVTDMVTVDPDPCPCGRILIRAKAIHGRNDDVLSLPARGGGQVAVHPLHFALLTGDPHVREFQVRQDGPVIRILIVPRYLEGPTTASDELETRLGRAVVRQLAQLGARDPRVSVERRHELARSAGGKLQLVIAGTHRHAMNQPTTPTHPGRPGPSPEPPWE